MQRYQQGDQDAIRELYMRTAPSIRKYLGRWSDWSKTQDLTQETFLQIHRARRTYRPELPLLPWMFAIARHVGLQHVRTAGRRVVEQESSDEQLLMASVPSAESSIAARRDLELTMRALTSEQREVLWLSDIEGFTSSEIARITGTTEGAVRVRLHRTHQKMKSLLSPTVEKSF